MNIYDILPKRTNQTRPRIECKPDNIKVPQKPIIDFKRPSSIKPKKTESEEVKLARNLKNKWHKTAPHLTDKFYYEVVLIAQDLNCNPNDLLAMMNSESQFDTAPNYGSARGLIQFTPYIAKLLGTTTKAIEKMTPEQQLPYVRKSLLIAKDTAGFKPEDRLNGGQLYAINFLPAVYRNAKNGVLSHKGDKYYAQNAAHADVDKDGKITVKDLAKLIRLYTP